MRHDLSPPWPYRPNLFGLDLGLKPCYALDGKLAIDCVARCFFAIIAWPSTSILCEWMMIMDPYPPQEKDVSNSYPVPRNSGP